MKLLVCLFFVAPSTTFNEPVIRGDSATVDERMNSQQPRLPPSNTKTQTINPNRTVSKCGFGDANTKLEKPYEICETVRITKSKHRNLGLLPLLDNRFLLARRYYNQGLWSRGRSRAKRATPTTIECIFFNYVICFISYSKCILLLQ